MSRVEGEGRPDLQHIPLRAGGRDEHAPRLQALDQRAREVRLADIDTDEQPRPAHGAGNAVGCEDGREVASQRCADRLRPRRQRLVAGDVEDREAGRRGDRAAAERGEEVVARREALRDGRGGDHRAHREPVADRLAQGDEIRHEAIDREAPEPIPDAAEPGLHLVGDEEAAGGADRIGDAR